MGRCQAGPESAMTGAADTVLGADRAAKRADDLVESGGDLRALGTSFTLGEPRRWQDVEMDIAVAGMAIGLRQPAGMFQRHELAGLIDEGRDVRYPDRKVGAHMIAASCLALDQTL